MSSSVSLGMEDYYIYAPYEVVARDSLIMVHNFKDDYHVTAIDLYTGTKQNLLRRGKGPGEALGMNALTSSSGSKYVNAVEANRGYLLDFRSQGDSLVCDFRKLPTAGPYTSVVRRDSMVVLGGMFEEGRFMYYNLKDSSYRYFCDYPEHPDYPELGYMEKGMLYGSCTLGMKPDGTRFVCVDNIAGRIDIYNIDDRSISLHKSLDFYPAEVRIESGSRTPFAVRKTNRQGFCDVDVSDECFYTIYSGRTFEEYGTALTDCEYLMTFDWEGDPLVCYRLDRPVNSISYVPEERAVYGLSVQDEALLVRFDLPEN